MIDGSALSFAENIKLSAEAVQLAHMAGVSVEGEIGTIGTTAGDIEKTGDGVIYTKPEDVSKFVSCTGVDSLAIAIGTSHGIYKPNCVPKLQIELLKEINKVSAVPLVLHGGSSNADEDIIMACSNGINKVNIASDFRLAFFQAVTKTLNDTKPFWGPKVYAEGVIAAQQVVEHKMRLFGCIGKASLYR
ncbi:D-tagatose-1,6-bisphosphate aldolase subunit KbaY [bioreactor metagenome]|uniref:D-tagatose-1,6-bisphosphate aldolase subunit KbaY n=1 Tax=bioreactor metagenome TaxID=1076179 RepID=A0A645H1W7_9ZZZZ